MFNKSAAFLATVLVLLALGRFLWIPGTSAPRSSDNPETVASQRKDQVSGQEPNQDMEAAVPAAVRALPVRHVFLNKTNMLGHVDADRILFYPWKGAVLNDEYFHSFRGPISGESVLRGEKFKEVLPVDPMIRYLLDESKTVRVGFLDPWHSTFLQWKSVQLQSNEMLPVDQDGRYSVVDRRSDVASVVEIDAPKHMVEQPHRWKKIAKSK